MGYHQASPPDELPPLLSAERLGTYHHHARAWGCDPIRLYLLGVELSASFMADLALVEVTLRNAMNERLSEVYGPRWWADEQLLDERSQAAVARAWSDGRCDDNAPPGQLVARLAFGFWVHLLEPGGYVGRSPYRQRRYYDAMLWRPALRHAFPHSTGVRSDVHALARRVTVLRNRVAHHEPVIAGVRLPGAAPGTAHAHRSPTEIHDDLVTLVRSISEPVGAWLAAHSRTPTLLGHRLPGGLDDLAPGRARG